MKEIDIKTYLLCHCYIYLNIFSEILFIIHISAYRLSKILVRYIFTWFLFSNFRVQFKENLDEKLALLT